MGVARSLRSLQGAVLTVPRQTRVLLASSIMKYVEFAHICGRALVVLNTLSAHSPWPKARDALRIYPTTTNR